eukprot:4312656-Amphidinium_carterae.1
MVRSWSSGSKKVPLQSAHCDVSWAREEPPGSSVPSAGASGSCTVALDPDECCVTRLGGASCAILP